MVVSIDVYLRDILPIQLDCRVVQLGLLLVPPRSRLDPSAAAAADAAQEADAGLCLSAKFSYSSPGTLKPYCKKPFLTLSFKIRYFARVKQTIEIRFP